MCRPVSVLFFLLVFVPVHSQKNASVRFIQSLTIPAQEQQFNIVEFFEDSTQVGLWKGSELWKIVRQSTVDDSTITVAENEIWYIYENVGTSELEIMKSLDEIALDLTTAAGRLEARRRLFFCAWAIKQQWNDSTGAFHMDRINSLGWFRPADNIIIRATAYNYGSYPPWSVDAIEQKGFLRENVYRFVSRRKPTTKELKQANP